MRACDSGGSSKREEFHLGTLKTAIGQTETTEAFGIRAKITWVEEPKRYN